MQILTFSSILSNITIQLLGARQTLPRSWNGGDKLQMVIRMCCCLIKATNQEAVKLQILLRRTSDFWRAGNQEVRVGWKMEGLNQMNMCLTW